MVKYIKYLHRSDWHFCVLAPDRSRFGSLNTQPNSAHVLAEDVPSEVFIRRTLAWRIPTSWPSKRIKSIQKRKSNVQLDIKLGRARFIAQKIKKKFKFSAFLFPDSDFLWVITAVATGIRLVRQFKANVIYAVAPPISALVIGLLTAFMTRKPYIVDYKDDWIGTATYKSFPVIIRRMHKLLERVIVKKAQCVITATPSSFNGFRQRHPEEDSSKFVHIPNGADPEEYMYLTNEKVRDRTSRKENQFIILNAGGYVPTHRNAKTFLEAIGLLLSDRPEFRNIVRIQFIGERASAFYGDILKRYDLNGIFVEYPIMKRREYIAALRSADLLLLIQALGYPTSIAGTFYEYWAAGKAPILIIGEQGDMWNLVHDYKLGFTVNYTDIQDIRMAIERVINAHLSGNPIRISVHGIKQYDRKRLAYKLADIFSQTIRK